MTIGRVASAAVFAAWMLLASGAAADITKEQCVDANTNGQNLRRDGKLADARAQFLLCNDPKCPEIVRTDCVTRFEEVESDAPAIIFDVKGSNGNDLAAVKISVDGKPLADKADGTPLKADPGSHEFTFEAQGEPTLKKTFVLREGEKSRHEAISFAPATPPPPPPPPAMPPPATRDSGDPLRIAAVVMGAAGVVGLGLGVIGGVEASSAWTSQKKDCTDVTNCTNHAAALSDHSSAESWGAVSTIGFVAGVALLAGGAVLYFLAPKADSSEPKAGRLDNPLRFSF